MSTKYEQVLSQTTLFRMINDRLTRNPSNRDFAFDHHRGKDQISRSDNPDKKLAQSKEQ